MVQIFPFVHSQNKLKSEPKLIVTKNLVWNCQTKTENKP